MANLGIGIIGAGNISSAYLRLAPLFKGLSSSRMIERILERYGNARTRGKSR